jgi:hypothetical protein
LILFFSLVALGLAFTLDRTVLNPDFVTAQGNGLEIAPLASEAMSQALPMEFSQESLDSLTETISALEPQLKDGLDTIVYSVYEYLHGERENLELASLLGLTFFSSDFIVSVVDTMDGPQMAVIVWEALGEEMAQELQLPEEAFPHLIADLGEMLTDLKSWLEEQVGYATGSMADYLTGQIDSFNVTISLEPLRDGLRGVLLGVFLDFPPDELEGLTPEELEQAFDASREESAGEVLPATLQIDETVVGQGGSLHIASFTSDAETALSKAREYVGYVRLAYILSIVVSLLAIAGIVLIYRNVRGSTRTLGTVFLASGLVVVALALVGMQVGGEQMLQAMATAPQQLQVWAPQVLVDLLAPLQWLGVGFITGGITLLVVSFVYKPGGITD